MSNIKKLNDLKNLEFTFTNEMKDLVIKMINIKQILNKNDISKEEKEKLQKKFNKLFKKFKLIFQECNKDQVDFVNNYLSQKNEEDK